MSHFALGFAHRDFLFQGFALIVEFFTGAERDLYLDQAVLYIDAQRNERFTTRIHRTDQFVNLAPMQEQLALTAWRMVLKVAEFIFANVRMIHPGLPFLDPAKSLADLGITRPYRFHFSALEDDTGLKTITHKIIVVGFTIPDLTLVIRGLFLGAHVNCFPQFGNSEDTLLGPVI